MRLHILGEVWNLFIRSEQDDERLGSADGYTDTSTRTCVVEKMTPEAGAKEDLDSYRRQVIRHELLHAFLYESGLEANSWAANEEMVDFFAIQYPKLKKLFMSAGADE